MYEQCLSLLKYKEKYPKESITDPLDFKLKTPHCEHETTIINAKPIKDSA